MQYSSVQNIRKTLEDEIASGSLAPGERLEELKLADRFGVSRTPVREALRLLATSGLIELQPRKGAVIAKLSMEHLIELFEVMSEMEGVCGRLAARRITEENQQALLQQHEICGLAAKSGDADSYYLENATFHSIIYNACHNDTLAGELKKMRRRLQPYRRLQLRMKGRIAESYREHEAIVSAICAGDEENAAKFLREHVSIQGNRFSDWAASVKTVLGTPETV